jgi:hypothetical protein
MNEKLNNILVEFSGKAAIYVNQDQDRQAPENQNKQVAPDSFVMDVIL